MMRMLATGCSRLLWLVALWLIALSGCGKSEDQKELEILLGNYLAKGLFAYENGAPQEALTNISQLFMYATNSGVWGYPYWLEGQFLRFGRAAGFTNSLLEKYIVLEPGIHVPLLRGDLVLMSAQPYLNSERRPERMLICKTGEAFVAGSYPEEHLQNLFDKAGREIPAGTSLPRPPPGPPIIEHKPSLTPEYIFKRLAVALGLQQSHWLTLLFLVLGIATTIFIGVVLWTARRVRHSSEESA